MTSQSWCSGLKFGWKVNGTGSEKKSKNSTDVLDLSSLNPAERDWCSVALTWRVDKEGRDP